jgi:hypothetical protein
LDNLGEEIVPVNERKVFESDEEGKIVLEHIPNGLMFVYDTATGKKITSWACNENILYLNE